MNDTNIIERLSSRTYKLNKIATNLGYEWRLEWIDRKLAIEFKPLYKFYMRKERAASYVRYQADSNLHETFEDLSKEESAELEKTVSEYINLVEAIGNHYHTGGEQCSY